jgi:hypothetical protein
MEKEFKTFNKVVYLNICSIFSYNFVSYCVLLKLPAINGKQLSLPLDKV